MSLNKNTLPARMEVRAIGTAQIDRMVTLDRECFPSSQAYDHDIFRALFQTPGIARGAFDRNLLVGFILATAYFSATGHIVTIDIQESYRRLGLGKMLMGVVERAFLEHGVGRIFLQVDERNRGAVAFYRALGYSVRRKLDHYYGVEKNGFLMGKEIYRRDDGPGEEDQSS